MITYDGRKQFSSPLERLALKFEGPKWKLRYSLERCNDPSDNRPIVEIHKPDNFKALERIVPPKALNALKAFFFSDVKAKKPRGIKIDWARVFIVPQMVTISGERNDFTIDINFATHKNTFVINIKNEKKDWSLEKVFSKKNSSGYDAGRWLGRVYYKWRSEKDYCPQ